MTIILGPAPCHACGKHIYWDGHRWNDPDGFSHSCVRGAKIGRRFWPIGKAGSHYVSWSKH